MWNQRRENLQYIVAHRKHTIQWPSSMIIAGNFTMFDHKVSHIGCDSLTFPTHWGSHTAYYGTQCHWDRLRPTQVFNTLNHPWITLDFFSQRVLMRNRVEAKERRSRKAGERVKQTRVSAVKRFLLQHNSLFRFLQRPASIPFIKRNMICQIK